MAPKIPEGWLESTTLGKPVDGTRFLPFKVPLKQALCNNLSPKDRFSPSKLMSDVPDLQLIIDLTNTSRYYDKDEFIKNGIDYEKIFCPGKMIPSPKLMLQFFDAVDKFMKSTNAKDKYIGVHCTHGINRTGYFICNYMVHKMGFTPRNAITAFQEARGHDIIREYLVEDLIKNCNTPPEERKPEDIEAVSYNGKRNKRKWNFNTSYNQSESYNNILHQKSSFHDWRDEIGPKVNKDPPLYNSSSSTVTKQPYSRYNSPSTYKNYGRNHNFQQNRHIRFTSDYSNQNSSQSTTAREETRKQDPFYRNSQLNYYEESDTKRSRYNNSRYRKNNKKSNS